MGNAELSCIFPDTHPLAVKMSISAEDLSRYPVITYVPQALLRRCLADYLSRPLNIQVEVATSMTGIVLAFHGAGVALVESSMLNALPGLTSRPLTPEVQVHGYVLWSALRLQTEIARTFMEHLKSAGMGITRQRDRRCEGVEESKILGWTLVHIVR